MSKLSSKAAISIFVTFFFCSGAAGLIYEVLWMRQFGLIMGNTTISLSAVLTAFMGGLAIGSWFGGRIADRRTDHLRLYGILEILIGAYAFCVPMLIAATKPILAPIYQADPNGFALIAIRFVFALLIMVIPTIFMGATLPILIKHFTAREDQVGERVGLIYGINTFGAMLGAFLAGFVLIPRLGMNLTNITAVLINVGVGVLALIIGWSSQTHISTESAASTEDAGLQTAAPPALPREVFAALLGIAISGMAAMIYQVCWTRLFALLLGSSVYSFSMVVMANICGLALGGVMFGRWIDRSKKPLMFFAAIQIFVAIVAYAIVYFSEYYPIYIIRMLTDNAGNYNAILLQEFVFISFLIFVPTFMMGGMFPIVARICAGDVRRLGKTIGTVYGINTIGAVIGSFTAGLIFMKYFGLWNAVMVAVGLNVLAGVIAIVAQSRLNPVLRFISLVPAVAIMAIVLIHPSQWKQQMMSMGPFYIDRFDDVDLLPGAFRIRAYEGDLVYYEDGLAGTVTVKKFTEGIPNTILAINGKIEASSNTGDMPTQLLCGHLGLLAYPEAKSAMLIGLGGGFTLGALTQNETLQDIDLVEISESVIEAVRTHFHDLTHQALDDPRVNVILGDGRNHLTLTDKKYDIIVNEPSNPWIAGISNLFTKEFFEGCLDRMTDEGVVVQWIHTYNMTFSDFMQVIKTFMSVMPHATLWEANDGDYIMIGAKRPIVFDWQEMSAILARPKIKNQMAMVNLDNPMVLMSTFMATKEQMQEVDAYAKAPLNVDDTCRLEFSAPRGFYDEENSVTVNQLSDIRFTPVPLFSSESLNPALVEQMESIKPARELVIEAGQFLPEGKITEAVTRYEEALAMNPRDPIVRRRAGEIYMEIMAESFELPDWPKAQQWALKMVDLFDDLEVSINRWDQARAFRILYLTSKSLNDQANMDRAEAGLLKIGGKKYAEKMMMEFPD